MRKTLHIVLVLLLFAAIGAPAALDAQTTYTVNQPLVDGGSATGTITTDGTIGALGESDIVGWNLTVNDGTATTDISSADSELYLGSSTDDIMASSSTITFDFGATDGGYLEFDENKNILFYAACASISYCGYSYSAIDAINIGGDNQYDSTPELGTQVIASVTATPEPGTAILWLTGIGLMILTRKRIANLLRPDPGTHGSLSTN